MNWKQLYSLSTPEERLEAVKLMLRTIETRSGGMVVYIDLQRILLRASFLGILGVLTLTTTIITAQAEPALILPVISAYLVILFVIFTFKPRKSVPVVQTVHYV